MLLVALRRELGRAPRAEGELHDPPVEERRARLDAHRHAHAVGLDEIVAAQQQLHVQVQRLVHAIEMLRLVEPGLGGGGEAVETVELPEHLGPVQGQLGGRWEQRDRIEIASLKRVCRQGSRIGLREKSSVFVVPRKQLVATVAGQHDLHMFRRQFADTQRGHERRIAMRLVEVVQHARPLRQHVELGDLAGVLAADALCRLQGERRLVIARVCEADAEGLDRPVHVARHQADDGARIDATRQEGAEGHVGAQANARGVVQQGHEFRRPVVETIVLLALVGQAPPTPGLHRPAAREFHPHAGHHMLDALVGRPRRGDVVEREVVVNRFQIDSR